MDNTSAKTAVLELLKRHHGKKVDSFWIEDELTPLGTHSEVLKIRFDDDSATEIALHIGTNLNTLGEVGAAVANQLSLFIYLHK